MDAEKQVMGQDGALTRLADQIRAAFHESAALDSSEIVAAGPDEGERSEIREAFTPWTWKNVPAETLRRDPGALSFMTPQGFRAFLPAYMLLSLEPGIPPGVELDTVLFLVTPMAGREAAVGERLNALDPKQLESLRAFLVFVRDRDALEFERGDYDLAVNAVEARMG